MSKFAFKLDAVHMLLKIFYFLTSTGKKLKKNIFVSFYFVSSDNEFVRMRDAILRGVGCEAKL